MKLVAAQGENNDGAKFIEGYAEGLTGVKLGDVGACIQNSGGLKLDIQKAMGHFQKKNKVEVAHGFKNLLGILKRLPTFLGQCKDLSPEALRRLKEFAGKQRSLPQMATKVTKNMALHGATIYKQLAAAAKAMVRKDYLNFGILSGKATAKAVS